MTENITDNEKRKNICKKLRNACNYLQTRFSKNCIMESECITHCIGFSLSNTLDISFQPKCNHNHDKICKDCFNVMISVMILQEEIKQLPENRETEIMLHDIEQCWSMIFSWQQHLLRGQQQAKAKINSMTEINLDNNTVLWIRDWAQKHLPAAGLESMEQYFGKNGISVHIDVFLMNRNDVWCKQVYLSVIDRCQQDLLDLLSLSEIVIEQFHEDFPNIDKIHCKSDNAGIYIYFT